MNSATISAIAGVLVFSAPCLAQTPVALVEDVRGNSAGVEFMDYLPAGKVIKLKSQDSVMLGYLVSCWSETITGGTVVIGSEQSDVQGGKVNRAKVPCNGGKIALTAKQANQSAGTSFRAPDDDPAVLYGVSPLIEATGGAAVLIARVDRPGEHHIITLPRKRNTAKSFVDLAATGKRLVPGGTYRASIGAREIVFKVDPGAKPGRLPIISRLLRFPPAG
jgi:hypothetical protein